jgi:hypothetical protein
MMDLDFALFILTRSDFPTAFCKALTSLASVPTTSYCPLATWMPFVRPALPGRNFRGNGSSPLLDS